ncbi:MAG: MFS transporter [Bacteroidota bacterium]|nr:MFS transporter [Bacteroidota bacterium]
MITVFRKLPRLFWVSNTIELFERWAWYGFYMAFALYLVGSKDTGALGFSQLQKGLIIGTGSALLYFLPLLTGAIADRLGYKKILLLSFAMYLSGYYMIGTFKSFELVFFAFIWTAVGGAFFKPIISAMVARTTDSSTASIGFGLFYMMVNIGGFIGPFIAGIILNKSWSYVFYMSIMTIGINVVLTLLFFKDPIRKRSAESIWETILQIFKNIGSTLADYKYVLFLLIISLFWTAFNQLYYSFPIFVDHWVDTSVVYRSIASISPWLASAIGTSEGTISAVTISSMDSFFIILFQLIISTIVMKYRPLSVMIAGMLIVAGGVGMMFSFTNGWIIILGILVFGIGEMSSSPKITEYIGRIAPRDKKALYMGTSYLPIALGHTLAGYLSGAPYEHVADKFYLIRKEVVAQGIHLPELSDKFTKNDLFNQAAAQMHMTPGQLSAFLWDKYHPSSVWIIYSGIAIGAMILLWLYDRFILKGQNAYEI